MNICYIMNVMYLIFVFQLGALPPHPRKSLALNPKPQTQNKNQTKKKNKNFISFLAQLKHASWAQNGPCCHCSLSYKLFRLQKNSFDLFFYRVPFLHTMSHFCITFLCRNGTVTFLHMQKWDGYISAWVTFLHTTRIFGHDHYY